MLKMMFIIMVRKGTLILVPGFASILSSMNKSDI